MSVVEVERMGAEVPPERRELSENAEQRTRLRKQADKAELRLALRDFAESLRGFIRAAPLTAIATAAGVGAVLATRKRRRPAARRRA
jgi:ElaB/YqjD/DUF883 family membrane-anchored ribosome-binding protein